MNTNQLIIVPDRQPTMHPSGRVLNLRTGLTRVFCLCGRSFTLSSQGEPQLLPGREGHFVVQRVPDHFC